MKVLNAEPRRYDATLREFIASHTDVDFVECESQQDLLKHISLKSYEALFLRLGLAADRSLFAACPTLRWVVTPTTGLDHIDLESAEQNSVNVVSLRGESDFLDTIPSTAEHTWALLLSLMRHLPQAHKDVVNYGWRREPFLSTELKGMTLGLLGCGRLGRMVARYGLAFEMKVLAAEIDEIARSKAPSGVEFTDEDALLTSSDILSIHLPLNQSTFGYLTAEKLSKLKPGARIINTARGELLDETKLLEFLKTDRIAGAALDVLCGDGRWDQGVPEGHPLVEYAGTHTNLILTPHMGGYGWTSIQLTRRFVTEKFLRLSGQLGEPAFQQL